MAGTVYGGTSGWAYPSWKPGFYPAKGVPARRFLEHYATRLNSVEVNYTFRALPTAEQLQGWLAAVPEHFRFSFKAPEAITHRKRLRDCADGVAAFVASLEPVRTAGRLGLLLFQLPPNFKADAQRLQDLLRLASIQGERLSFEFRHPSWFTEQTYGLLRAANAALCVAESEDLQTPEVHTAATFASFRLRMPGGYGPRKITAQAKGFTALAADGRDIYVYYKHEDEPTGPLAAESMLAKLSRNMVQTSAPSPKPSSRYRAASTF